MVLSKKAVNILQTYCTLGNVIHCFNILRIFLGPCSLLPNQERRNVTMNLHQQYLSVCAQTWTK